MLLQLQAAVAEGRTEEAAAAEAELSELGGRACYQAASELTTSRHRTCKWIFSLLTQMKLRPGKGQPPLKVLEVCLLYRDLLLSLMKLVLGKPAKQLPCSSSILSYSCSSLVHCTGTLFRLGQIQLDVIDGI